ncbi:MAG: hypothetical protein NTU74_13200 [Deltaproteobacteria bacterium]|nr:hypothetical protein [Deltaproteobacteria bacterium]
MDYLLSFDEVTEPMIERHLSEWKERKPTSLIGLFRAFIMHAQNRQGMPNAIGDIDNLSDILFDFRASEILSKYASWGDLFDAIQSSGYTPPGRMQKNNNKSYWVIYCKAIISIAQFLSSYKALQEFDDFVSGFLTNEYSRLALPLLLEKEIFGFGFALACDCLKENGYPQFIKPDTHLNDISRGLGITGANSDYQVFKDVEAYCRRNSTLPYEVDKLFWLVGSGRFYLFGVKINSSKWDFLKRVKG